ncbi:DUF1330 domain-containing protein [Labilibacter sediminis]|nr:DUF1330 domain-containing protein [Labilibacter sediminis]
MVIVEFPYKQAAEDFYNDPEYRPLIAVRNKVSKSNAVIFEKGI